MIDLHTHTNKSDGTSSPAQLIAEAVHAGLSAIAVTDHDTFDGYLAAGEPAREAGLDLVCGIEVSTHWHRNSHRQPLHLLSYFLKTAPATGFTGWLSSLRDARAERNRQLSRRLCEMGMPVAVEDVEAIGSTITGRVHFARIMVERGYVASLREAFDRYLGEKAPAYVAMDDPPVTEVMRRVREGGGLPVVAHPRRMNWPLDKEEEYLRQLADDGLAGIEVVHSDHASADRKRYQGFAAMFGLSATGGSDFHGRNKPHVMLGRGIEGNVQVPDGWLAALRQRT